MWLDIHKEENGVGFLFLFCEDYLKTDHRFIYKSQNYKSPRRNNLGMNLELHLQWFSREGYQKHKQRKVDKLDITTIKIFCISKDHQENKKYNI